jgi:IS605 OrfB family transposase
MLARKSFQYRLRLTKKQNRALDTMLDGCRWLYNLFLEQRILSFEELGMSLTKCQQLMFLPELKEDKPELKEIHEKISNQRKDFCHKESRKIVDRYQFICIEDLDIKNMVKNSCFAKNIMDASWNQFCQFLTYRGRMFTRRFGFFLGNIGD